MLILPQSLKITNLKNLKKLRIFYHSVSIDYQCFWVFKKHYFKMSFVYNHKFLCKQTVLFHLYHILLIDFKFRSQAFSIQNLMKKNLCDNFT